MTEKKDSDEKQAIESTESIKPADEKPMKIKKQSKLKNFLSAKKGKTVAALIGIAVVIAILLGVPATRYATLGYFVKKEVKVSVIDATTKKPVSDAVVKLNDQSVKTSAQGEATLKNISVGEYTISIAKKYYKDSSLHYTVPVLSNPKAADAQLQATGRQVTIRVTNLITKTPLAKATVAVDGTSATTNEKGEATIVLPADKKSVAGTLRLSGYNDANISIVVTDQAGKNDLTLTPSGKVLYLSNRSGTVDIMKSNLDGSEATVIAKGTGNEDMSRSILRTSPDWKHAVFMAHRTNDADMQLYAVNAENGTLKLIDQGNKINFNLIGWSERRFVYIVDRYNKKDWESGHQSLKSYDAAADKLAVIDDTTASGSSVFDYKHEELSNAFLIDGKVVYGKSWLGGALYGVSSPIWKKGAIMSVAADGSNKQRLKEFPANVSVTFEARPTGAKTVSFMVKTDMAEPAFYQYNNATLTSVASSVEKFYASRWMSYFISPVRAKTFWSEYRDGKNTIFIGNDTAGNVKTIATQSDFSPYGWFGEDYILLSKNRSELYVAPANGSLADGNAIKITNYYPSN